MSHSKDDYLSQSPNKILQKAQQYSKTLDNYLELPKEHSKILRIITKAERQRSDIDYAIQISQYQQRLFRHQETIDGEERQTIMKKIEQGKEKNSKNLKQISKKNVKRTEQYEKHMKLVSNRYNEQERKRVYIEREQSTKLREDIKDFIEKQQTRKIQKQRNQSQVSSCHQKAVERMNSIHQQNEEHSRQAKIALEMNLQRNSNFDEQIRLKREVLSRTNKRKSWVYSHSVDILKGKRTRNIQTCGKNEDGYLNAWEKMEQTITDWRKKKTEETKRQLDRWKENKYRVEETKQYVPQKCLNILDKTSKSQFRKTASSFQGTPSDRWNEKVQENKEGIRQKSQKKKDRIMDLHLDLSLKNTSSNKISQKMNSMRHQAKKLAYDYL